MLVKDIMTTQVLTIQETASLREVIQLLVEIDISGLVVVNALEEVVGVITGKDVLVAFDYLQQIKAPIKDYVSEGVISVSEETTVEEVSRLLVQNNILRVPVLRDKKLVGIVSRRDVLRHIYKTN
ncbi:MAG: CBS domain-containing protein [Candidatus Omnitrophica bacterium]|nr:CBS domain-containing protein [Candidatus Omnitrophota bacterium]MBU1996269.1 CBS domain-containing protein [Candidatus Omnitrophota bacterium]MBU4334525.1 CBS domain-containing protein [Candidatus Omnitrophota bacterium]